MRRVRINLREYYIDDIKLDNAEQVERMLSRMLLVNIDEYNAKTEREQAKIKRVLTERDVQTRKMRSDQYVMLPRMASFVATTNDFQPLYDPTGSRRSRPATIPLLAAHRDRPAGLLRTGGTSGRELHQGC